MENQDLLEALDFLDPGNLTYEEWTIVGMGLKQGRIPGNELGAVECPRWWPIPPGRMCPQMGQLPRQPQPRYREQHL